MYVRIVAICRLFFFFLLFLQVSVSRANVEQLLTMDFFELVNVRVSNVGSLTETTLLGTPAAVTQITAQQISESGARSLQELVEIYVPGLQWARHHWELSHLGTRGVISDREDKVMIRVNGRVMNERTHAGAVTEHAMPMLGDIQYIDVIRGPGSSLHGLGAVSMVIDIHTHNARSRPGGTVLLKGGVGNVFQSIEASYGGLFGEDTALWLYFATAKMEGADDSDAPWVLGAAACPKTPANLVNKCQDVNGNVDPAAIIPAGHRFPIGLNDGLQYRDRAPVKVHLQLDQEDTTAWLRYTRAGEVEPADIPFSTASTLRFGSVPEVKAEFGYEQFTAFYERRQRLNDQLGVTGVVSFDLTELYRRILPGSTQPFFNHREREWFAKIHFDWEPSESSSVVFGAEYSRETFGLNSRESSQPFSPRLGEMDAWDTNTSSLVGEWQWRPSTEITLFLGGRVDDNTYSDLMWSPRASIVWMPREDIAWKLIASRSQRMLFAEDTRAEALAGLDESDPETLDSLELRVEKITDRQKWAASLFYIDLDAIGRDVNLQRSVIAANQKQTGLEIEWSGNFGPLSLSLSHAYTHLLDFSPKNNAESLISVEPFDDLSNWSNHITKFQVGYQASPRLKFHSTLRAYWKFDGLQDRLNLIMEEPFRSRFIDDGWDEATEKQLFLNAGLEWQASNDLTVGFNLYNLMGLIHKKYNKRIYFNTLSDYRSEAVAAALTLEMRFD